MLWIAQASSFPISGEGIFGGIVLVAVIGFLWFRVVPQLLAAKQEIIELQSARIEVLTKRADDLTEAVKSSSARDEAAIQQGWERFIGEDGGFVGLNHETILYDAEALAEPLRIVRNLHKINRFSDADQTPYTFIECVQTIFSVDGHNAPLSPGAVVEYEVPDMYGRPWAHIWEKYWEEGMERREEDDIFDFE